MQNLRAAAEVLHLTHSAVSQQIRGSAWSSNSDSCFSSGGGGAWCSIPGEKPLLHSVRGALAQLDDGGQAAAAASGGSAQRLRVTVLPSFAQRWLLPPRMSRWRERHPGVALEIATPRSSWSICSARATTRALRYGSGPWPGLASERLFGVPTLKIVVGSPSAARRLAGAASPRLLRANRCWAMATCGRVGSRPRGCARRSFPSQCSTTPA